MVVKIDDARIEVELDVQRALGELKEIESSLDRAKGARRGAPRRTDKDRTTRSGLRGAGAAVAAGRLAGGGLRGAVRFAAKVGGGLTIAEVVRKLPALIPAIIGREGLDKTLIPEIDIPEFNVFGQTFFEGKEFDGLKVRDAVESLGKKIAQIEATLKTTIDAGVLAYDMLAEGRLAEAGGAALSHLTQALSPGPRDKATTDFLGGVGKEFVEIIDAYQAYNTAEALFRQRTVNARASGFIDDSMQGFRAGGGGVSK